jgi:hypothetical protein
MLSKGSYTQVYDDENTENSFYQKLFFEEFLPRLPDQFIIFNKTIPFHTIRIILGSFRYTKWDIREIVKKWVSLGLVEYSKFRGIRLRGDEK